MKVTKSDELENLLNNLSLKNNRIEEGSIEASEKNFSETSSLKITNKDLKKLINILNRLLKEHKEDDDKVISQEEIELQEKIQNLIELELKKNCSNSITFHGELNRHWDSFDYINVIIVAGEGCCDLSGVICGVYHDFIVIMDNQSKVKIPTDKIAAIKLSKDKSSTSKKNKALTKNRKEEVVGDSLESEATTRSTELQNYYPIDFIDNTTK